MKKPSAGSQRTKFIATASAFIWTIAIATSARGAQLQEARVTQVVNDVKLLLEQAAPRPAVVSDLVRRGNAVRTGTQSRSELTFADLTITRLGANTIFSFKEGTREMTLIDGAILFQVPKGSGGATIRTVGVTAAITGTTGIGEFHPATSSNPLFSKWLCLEGTFSLYLPNGQSLQLGPGKMVTTDGKSFSKVMTFDIKKLVSTSLFFTGFDQPLASMNLIMLESENQLASSLLASTTTNPLDPTRIVNVTSQAIVAEEAQTSPTPSITPPPPSPTPSKFGTPSVISSPNPYLITNGTVIKTDPSITTNGVTDFGKIYRGQTDDGAFSLWAFGSTSPFDTALRIDSEFFADPNHLPIAVFKFQSLSLNGNPTIDLSNGGVTKLVLIGVDGITSAPPGGTLTFTGLDLLLLATVNGSINLTSDVSFQGLNELAMYARGAGSNLLLNSPITNIGTLELAAEGSIQLSNPGTMSVGDFETTAGDNLTLQIGGSLLLDGKLRLHTLVLPGTTVANGANLTLNIAGDYTNSSATEFSRLSVTNEGAHIGTGGNNIASIGGDLTTTGTSGDFALVVQNTSGQIDNGGNIALMVGGNVSTQGQLSLLVENYDGANPAGHIGTGGNIFVTAVGDLTADSIFAFINNRNGGSIDSGASLAFNVGGTLTTTGDATFGTSNRNDGSGGGTIGSLAIVGINAASISVGGFFQTFISTNGGGSIQGDAINAVNSSGDLTAQDGILLDITTTIFGGTGNFTGGHIGGNAIVALSAQNIITPSTASGVPGTDTMALEASIYPNTGGTVGGDAIVDVSASQGISAPGSVLFWVANGNYQNLGPGMIGGNAEVNVSASNISTGDFFDQILNYGGASIGGHASIDVTANTLSVGGNLDSRIDNSQSGSIGSSATITFNLSGILSTQGDALFQIQNNDGGQIMGNGTINVAAASISNQGNLSLPIFNQLGSIDGDAAIHLTLSGDIVSQHDASFLIWNFGVGPPAGTIGGNALINVVAHNLAAANGGILTGQILNQNVGFIGGNAIMNFDVSGDINAGDAAFIINNIGGMIGHDARINLTATNISVAGNLGVTIDNNTNGGTIGGAAVIDMNTSGIVTVTNNATVEILGSGLEGSAEINFNGGTYDVGDTFLTTMLNDGQITFNNASVHADVLKAGVFGSNGALNIGGGTLSADSTLKLYAPGSNGQLNFVSNVTLGGNSAKILAANSVTIFNNVVVTIGGPNPADVYTNNANYTGFGGNGTTTGTFAGAGAHDPQPLSSAPPFGLSTPRNRTAQPVPPIALHPPHNRTNGGGMPRTHFSVRNSDELLALLDRAAPGPGGKITIPPAKSTSNSRNSNRTDVADRSNAGSRVNADRRAMDMRTASSSVIRRSSQ
jgi:hypothetical protein